MIEADVFLFFFFPFLCEFVFFDAADLPARASTDTIPHGCKATLTWGLTYNPISHL